MTEGGSRSSRNSVFGNSKVHIAHTHILPPYLDTTSPHTQKVKSLEILPLSGRQAAISHYRSAYKTPKMDQICPESPVRKEVPHPLFKR